MDSTDPPADARSLEARIHAAYPTLSPAERRMADTLLLHQMDLPLYTAGELAQEAAVSTATAARLIRTLGYASYPEAKRRIREESHWGSPQAGLIDARQVPLGDGQPQPARMVAATIDNLRATFDLLSPTEIEAWRDAICATPQLWVLGLRNSFGLAHVAGHLLGLAKEGVRVLPASGTSMGADLASVRAGDVVLVVALRRRPRLLAGLLRAMRQAGATTLLLTDVSAAESARAADRVIRCRCRSPSPFISFAAAMTVIDCLAWEVAHHLGDASAARFRRIDDMVRLFEEVSIPVRG